MENVGARARIRKKTKEEASAVLAAMGLTIPEAFRLIMRRIVQKKALPSGPFIPRTAAITGIAVSSKIPALLRLLPTRHRTDIIVRPD